MANRHFGKFGDVWKHLALAAVLAHEKPRIYAETHAGSAAYPMVEDAERRFGAHHFMDACGSHPELACSRYRELITPFLTRPEPLYPGSPTIAISALGTGARYLFCDLDSTSVATLREWVGRLGADHAVVEQADGMATVKRWLEELDGIRALVQVDPFDPDAQNAAGVSALALAAEIILTGQMLSYWYGYDEPAEAGWAYQALRDLSADREIWCGDMMITDSSGAGTAGDLGIATTPGTGCGIVLANVKAQTTAACEGLGMAFARAYENTTLPSGEPGGVRFTALSSP